MSTSSVSMVSAVIEALQEGFATWEDLRYELEQARDVLHVEEVSCPPESRMRHWAKMWAQCLGVMLTV